VGWQRLGRGGKRGTILGIERWVGVGGSGWRDAPVRLTVFVVVAVTAGGAEEEEEEEKKKEKEKDGDGACKCLQTIWLMPGAT